MSMAAAPAPTERRRHRMASAFDRTNSSSSCGERSGAGLPLSFQSKVRLLPLGAQSLTRKASMPRLPCFFTELTEMPSDVATSASVRSAR